MLCAYQSDLEIVNPDPVCGKFTDIDTTMWYHNGVHYCIENGLMSGTGDNHFSPNVTMIRSSLAMILWVRQGVPYSPAEMPFADVMEGTYYRNAVKWCYEKGLMAGTSNDTFSPNMALTREQVVVIFYKYACLLNIKHAKRTPLEGFPDNDSVAGWARDAFSWALSYGIISGASNGNGVYLAPQLECSRAQVAVMLMRFADMQEHKCELEE